jgi:DNA-binding NarL/FixJ family response regulator
VGGQLTDPPEHPVRVEANRLREPAPAPPVAPALTSRETEVLRCIARGLSNPDTGRQLYISEATVKSHVTRIFEKLGVSDRTAAVTVAIARGILPSPER